MLSTDDVIPPNANANITTEGKLTLDYIKEYIDQNSMHLMLYWWDKNMFYNTYFTSNYAMHNIINDFVY